MSTVMRNTATWLREPSARGQRRAPARTAFLHWTATHPGVTSVALTVVYLATLVALVGVLNASALASPLGALVGVLLLLEIVVYLAIAAYIVRPEGTRQ